MAGASSYTVVLFSNAQTRSYPDNKPYAFHNELGTPLNLSYDWEVALLDIQYTHTWDNFVRPVKVCVLAPTDRAKHDATTKMLYNEHLDRIVTLPTQSQVVSQQMPVTQEMLASKGLTRVRR